MVGPSYKENKRLISGEEEREEKKADSESMEATSWSLSDSG